MGGGGSAAAVLTRRARMSGVRCGVGAGGLRGRGVMNEEASPAGNDNTDEKQEGGGLLAPRWEQQGGPGPRQEDAPGGGGVFCIVDGGAFSCPRGTQAYQDGGVAWYGWYRESCQSALIRARVVFLKKRCTAEQRSAEQNAVFVPRACVSSATCQLVSVSPSVLLAIVNRGMALLMLRNCTMGVGLSVCLSVCLLSCSQLQAHVQ